MALISGWSGHYFPSKISLLGYDTTSECVRNEWKSTISDTKSRIFRSGQNCLPGAFRSTVRASTQRCDSGPLVEHQNHAQSVGNQFFWARGHSANTLGHARSHPARVRGAGQAVLIWPENPWFRIRNCWISVISGTFWCGVITENTIFRWEIMLWSSWN